MIIVSVNDEVLSRDNIWLVFHGLDTVGKIYLNNQTLGEVNNMFVRYRYDVKSLLKVSMRTISSTDCLYKYSSYSYVHNI